MNLHHLSVGFEHPAKLLVRHLRIQVSNKEVFHDVSPIGNCLIVACDRALRQEDEVESPASTGVRFFSALVPIATALYTRPLFSPRSEAAGMHSALLISRRQHYFIASLDRKSTRLNS